MEQVQQVHSVVCRCKETRRSKLLMLQPIMQRTSQRVTRRVSRLGSGRHPPSLRPRLEVAVRLRIPRRAHGINAACKEGMGLM